jgi:hypothetical protein
MLQGKEFKHTSRGQQVRASPLKQCCLLKLRRWGERASLSVLMPHVMLLRECLI